MTNIEAIVEVRLVHVECLMLKPLQCLLASHHFDFKWCRCNLVTHNIQFKQDVATVWLHMALAYILTMPFSAF